MQYADGGNLRTYLKNNFFTLSWNDKIKLAYQITEGIKNLHDKDIFHQNLHSKSILMHQEEAKIMLDIVKSTKTDYLDGSKMILYVNPKLLENKSYEYDKKSDIYSLGVLMWELTSGYPPKNENILKNHIIDGYRENQIPGTPKEYLDIYKSCWDYEPNERPSINQVFDKLGKMLYTHQNEKDLEPLELIKLIKINHLIKVIAADELSVKNNIDESTFDTILEA